MLTLSLRRQALIDACELPRDTLAGEVFPAVVPDRLRIIGIVMLHHGDHRVGILEREGDRFFHDHVRSGFETVADDLPLDAAAECDRRELGALLGEHGAVVGVELYAGALLLREHRKRLFAVFLHEIASATISSPVSSAARVWLAQIIP